MKRLWDFLAGVIITGMVLYMLFALIRPYALIVVIALVLGILGERYYRMMRRG